MPRGLLFAGLGLPPVLWPLAHLWAEPRYQAWSDAWSPGSGDLGVIIRIAYSFDLWTIRMLPFIMLPVLLAQPLIAWAIAAATGSTSSPPAAEPRDVLYWWFISAAPSAELLIITAVWGDRLPFQVGFYVLWVVLVAFWITIAAAYGVQRRHFLELQSKWHPNWLLGTGWLGGCGWLLLPVLGVVALRREGLRRAG